MPNRSLCPAVALLLAAAAAAHAREPLPAERPVVARGVKIKVSRGHFTARLYSEEAAERRAGLVLLPGLEAQGIDDPRLIRFARLLARERFVVLTPETAGTRELRLDQDSITDTIAAFDYLAESNEVDARRVGLWGICMAGAVALQAASDPRLARRAAFVVALESYYDLGSALRFLLSGEYEAEGQRRLMLPNRYARAVALANYVDYVYQGADRESVRQGVTLLLTGRDGEALALKPTLAPAGQSVIDLILAPAPPGAGSLAPEAARVYGELVAAMRARIPLLLKPPAVARIECPVFLVHTEDSDYFPPGEGQRLQAALAAAGRRGTLVVTSLFNHVTPKAGAEGMDVAATAADLLRLAAFLGEVRAFAAK